MIHKLNRRDFIKKSGLVLGVTTIGSTAFASVNSNTSKIIKTIEDEEEVSPAEDLMREHGVLKRILIIYYDLTTIYQEVHWFL